MIFRQLIHAAQKKKKGRNSKCQMHLSILEYQNHLPFPFAPYATRLPRIPWATYDSTYQEKLKKNNQKQPNNQNT